MPPLFGVMPTEQGKKAPPDRRDIGMRPRVLKVSPCARGMQRVGTAHIDKGQGLIRDKARTLGPAVGPRPFRTLVHCDLLPRPGRHSLDTNPAQLLPMSQPARYRRTG